MDIYRKMVRDAASSANGKDVVLNRTAEHASVIVEFLFGSASSRVQILTTSLDDKAYGTPGVINTAIAFLQKNRDSAIDILSEGTIDCAENKLIRAIRAAGHLHQVTVTPVPRAVRDTYSYHVIIADSRHFRYQKDRMRFDASVQFGNDELGAKLSARFDQIKSQAILHSSSNQTSEAK
jgi:hypothetical protein